MHGHPVHARTERRTTTLLATPLRDPSDDDRAAFRACWLGLQHVLLRSAPISRRPFAHSRAGSDAIQLTGERQWSRSRRHKPTGSRHPHRCTVHNPLTPVTGGLPRRHDRTATRRMFTRPGRVRVRDRSGSNDRGTRVAGLDTLSRVPVGDQFGRARGDPGMANLAIKLVDPTRPARLRGGGRRDVRGPHALNNGERARRVPRPGDDHGCSHARYGGRVDLPPEGFLHPAALHRRTSTRARGSTPSCGAARSSGALLGGASPSSGAGRNPTRVHDPAGRTRMR